MQDKVLRCAINQLLMTETFDANHIVYFHESLPICDIAAGLLDIDKYQIGRNQTLKPILTSGTVFTRKGNGKLLARKQSD
jgi:hypothetical protein